MEIEPQHDEAQPANTEEWVNVTEARLPGEAEALTEALSVAGIPFEEVEHVNRPVTHALIVEAPLAISSPLILIGLMMRHWVLSAERPKEPKVLGKEDERGDF